MKNLVDKLNEALSKYRAPELGGHEIAYDINGDEWIVDAFCYADGGAPEGVNSLERLLKLYDFSGAIAEEIKTKRVKPDDIIVGCHAKDDEDDVIAAVWGKYMSYENKK